MPRRRKPPFRKRLLKTLAFMAAMPFMLSVFYLLIPPPSTLMLADMSKLTWPKRDWVPLERISPALIAAVVTAEDSAFCSHFGFDLKQIEKSIDVAVDGGSLRGASTITQQTAKNLFLWNGRSWVRKALEVPLTLWLELVMPKRRILEIYLNIAEWGPNLYGAQAAAKHYFGVRAGQLSLPQSALLATTLPNPSERSASYPGPAQREMAGTLRARTASRAADLSCLK